MCKTRLKMTKRSLVRERLIATTESLSVVYSEQIGNNNNNKKKKHKAAINRQLTQTLIFCKIWRSSFC